MTTLILKIEYDGSAYGGWQRQKNNNSVQEEIENALNNLAGFKPEDRIIKITGAGRTDAGVHARGQVADCILPDEFSIPENKIQIALNANLPEDIRIRDVCLLNKEFNSRFDAIGREYSYTVTTDSSVFYRHYASYIHYKIDFDKLNEAAGIFVGKHDFTTFSKHNPATKSYICDVETCSWEMIEKNIYRLKIKADRFVYGMVRALTGAMIDAARGKRNIEELKESLKAADRKYISQLAPAKGLVLEKIYYPDDLKIFS